MTLVVEVLGEIEIFSVLPFECSNASLTRHAGFLSTCGPGRTRPPENGVGTDYDSGGGNDDADQRSKHGHLILPTRYHQRVAVPLRSCKPLEAG